MKEDRSRAFIKGTVSLSVSVIIIKVLGVAFKVPLSYVLGDEGMGYFNTAYAIYGLFYILCTAGVPKSLSLVISGYRADSGDTKNDVDILKCGLSLFAGIGAFSTLLNIICAPVFAGMVGNRGAYLSIITVAPSIFFVSLSGVLRGYLNSTERLTVIAVSQLIEGAVKLVLGLAFAFVGVRLRASIQIISALAIAGITVGSAISFCYMIILTFYQKSELNMRQNTAVKRIYIKKKILKNALPIALSATLLNLSSTLDLAIIIRRLVSSGMSESYANAIYGNYTTLAVPMFNLVISVLAPLATSYMPRLTDIYLSRNDREFTETLNRLLIITLLISVPASLTFYFYSFDLLDVLFSLQSSATGAEMLVTLALGVCLLSALTVVNTALEAQGRIGATVFSLLLGCVVKMLVSYTLIGSGSVGILGAPIGTVISYALSLSVSLLMLERCGVRCRAVLKACALYALGIVAFYPPYRLIYSTALMSTSFWSMSVSLALSFAAYALLLGGTYFMMKGSSVFKVHKK